MSDNELNDIVDEVSKLLDRNIKKHFPNATENQIKQLACFAMVEMETDGGSGGDVCRLLFEGI